MKGWKLSEKKSLAEKTFEPVGETTKIRITKALITLSDVLRYNAELESNNVCLGSYGIGIVSETTSNMFGLEKGKHVYIEPNRPCEQCYNCKNGEETKCSDLLTAGEDFDGFLADFATADASKLFLLPESVSGKEALFIGHISQALAIIDKLNVQKGEYVAIIGDDNLGIILAELLIYYQSVPILIGAHDESLEIAKNSGVYYTLGPDDNWQKEIGSITGGRMAKNVVYISDCGIPANKAFALASFNAGVAFTGVSFKNNPVSMSLALKKQLDVHCINSGFGNTASSINLLANKAIDLSFLKLGNAVYADVPNVFKTLSEEFEKTGTVTETIVDLI